MCTQKLQREEPHTHFDLRSHQESQLKRQVASYLHSRSQPAHTILQSHLLPQVAQPQETHLGKVLRIRPQPNPRHGQKALHLTLIAHPKPTPHD